MQPANEGDHNGQKHLRQKRNQRRGILIALRDKSNLGSVASPMKQLSWWLIPPTTGASTDATRSEDHIISTARSGSRFYQSLTLGHLVGSKGASRSDKGEEGDKDGLHGDVDSGARRLLLWQMRPDLNCSEAARIARAMPLGDVRAVPAILCFNFRVQNTRTLKANPVFLVQSCGGDRERRGTAMKSQYEDGQPTH